LIHFYKRNMSNQFVHIVGINLSTPTSPEDIIQVRFVGFPPIKSEISIRQNRKTFLSIACRQYKLRAPVHRPIVFIYKLHKIKAGDTPHNLGMKDNDVVEVHEEKTFNAYVKKFKDKQLVSKKTSRFIQDLAGIMERSDSSDFTIKCEERTFPVHRLFLTGRSSVFRAMLNTEMVEAVKKEVVITDIDPDTVQEMIKFIYTGELSGKQVDLQAIWHAADKYDVNGLKDAICSKMKNEKLRGEDVADMFVISHRHSNEQVKKIALSKLKEDLRLLDDADFKARMIESGVTFNLFQDVCYLLFSDSTS